ncbi:MAG: hypothetical protein GXP37_09790, partial [Chloroflexi bacterium]|nr:hypothetical protein [Chloroflexota bacterium]
MDKPIVACIQHRLIVPKTHDEFDAYLQRFLRTAQAKGTVLALFPELSGLVTAIPNFTGWRNELLKTAGQSHPTRRTLWQRTKARLAGSAANVMRADLQRTLLQYLQEMPESLQEAYVSVFANLARQYEMTIVAGSMYEHDPATGDIRNVALVFGPDGTLLGKQAKVVLAARDRKVAAAAEGWGLIPTPVGRVGILLGNDVLYPEPARVLAYQGADMLLAMGAVTKPATYHKIRQATLARCQENQLYGMVSFLVGPDAFAGPEAAPFLGKSAIFAPLEFTPRFSGVMVEVGSPMAEGVITAEWDYPALHSLWQESDTPLRREMPLLQAGPVLASVYARALPLAEAEPLMLTMGAEVPEAPAEAPQPDTEESGPVAAIEGALEAIESGLIRGLTPILPPVPSSIQEDMATDADELAHRVEIHSRNVDAAASEVRESIAKVSAQLRSAVAETPEKKEAHIQQALELTRQVLDEAPNRADVSVPVPVEATAEPDVTEAIAEPLPEAT